MFPASGDQKKWGSIVIEAPLGAHFWATNLSIWAFLGFPAQQASETGATPIDTHGHSDLPPTQCATVCSAYREICLFLVCGNHKNWGVAVIQPPMVAHFRAANAYPPADLGFRSHHPTTTRETLAPPQFTHAIIGRNLGYIRGCMLAPSVWKP